MAVEVAREMGRVVAAADRGLVIYPEALAVQGGHCVVLG